MILKYNLDDIESFHVTDLLSLDGWFLISISFEGLYRYPAIGNHYGFDLVGDSQLKITGVDSI